VEQEPEAIPVTDTPHSTRGHGPPRRGGGIPWGALIAFTIGGLFVFGMLSTYFTQGSQIRVTAEVSNITCQTHLENNGVAPVAQSEMKDVFHRRPRK
jgi:hypothetical protein